MEMSSDVWRLIRSYRNTFMNLDTFVAICCSTGYMSKDVMSRSCCDAVLMKKSWDSGSSECITCMLVLFKWYFWSHSEINRWSTHAIYGYHFCTLLPTYCYLCAKTQKAALFTGASFCTYIWAVLREAPASYEIMMAQYVCWNSTGAYVESDGQREITCLAGGVGRPSGAW